MKCAIKLITCFRKTRVALLLETFSLVTFFDVDQRKLPALQRGTRDIKEEPEVLRHKAAHQNINPPVTQQDSAQAHSNFQTPKEKPARLLWRVFSYSVLLTL